MRVLLAFLSFVVGPVLMFISPVAGYAIGYWAAADGVSVTVALVAGIVVGLAGYCVLWYGLHQLRVLAGVS